VLRVPKSGQAVKSMKENKPIRVLLVEDNAVNARFAEGLLTQVESQTFQISVAGTLLAALDMLVHESFDVAVADLSLPDSQGLETFLTIKRHSPALPVIILTGLDDEATALSAVQQGAQDFLVKGKLTKDVLVRAVTYAIARNQKPTEAMVRAAEKASILGLLGSNGGVGTTTVAAHLALQLHLQTDQKVLLLDLDCSSTGASFLMKMGARYTLTDATENLHRLDMELWKGMVSTYRDGVDLLPGPGAAGIRDAPTAERIRHVLRFAQSLYYWIVVDLGRLTASSLAVLEASKELFVITTPELTALFEASRMLRRLLEAGLSQDKLHLLLNRKARRLSLSVEDIEKALGYPIYGSITDTPEEFAGAYAERRFLDDDLLVHKQIAQVMRKWRGVEEKGPPASGLGFLRRLRAG
jgi:Flp pilus assembly CpaE family ATPase